jgi:hypothetical protein
MTKRGVLYLHWGPDRRLLDRSLASLRVVHPDLPVETVRLPDSSTLLDKASMMRRSPFEETLFLDADTLVLGSLDFGFERAVQHGLACCINEMPWARRYRCFNGDEIEYNTGVLFFTRRLQELFDRWEGLSRTIDSAIFIRRNGELGAMACNDQASFAKAIDELGFNPYVLPHNWNFRPTWQPSWWGPIRIWHHHEDPSPVVVDFVARQSQPKAGLEYACFSPPGR